MVDTAVQTGAENVVWDLSVFYNDPTDPAINADVEAVDVMVAAFVEQYRGRVGQLLADEMLNALQELEALLDKLFRLLMYANLLYATDTNNAQFGALLQRFTEYRSEIEQKLLFFDLEWMDVDEAVAQMLINDLTLSHYRHYLEAERRYQPYKLSEIEEQLLVEKAVTGNNAWTRFFSQLMGASRYDFDGEELTQSQILAKLQDPDREVRRKASESLTAGLRDVSMQTTYIFNVLAADKAGEDKRRGYDTWVSSRNLSNKVSDDVVEALVNAVTSNYDIVAQHYNLKRTLLGYDELTHYDRYAPLPVAGNDRVFTWDEARDIVQKAYNAFSRRWLLFHSAFLMRTGFMLRLRRANGAARSRLVVRFPRIRLS